MILINLRGLCLVLALSSAPSVHAQLVLDHSGGLGKVQNQNNTPLTLWSNNLEWMRINTDGTVGVGTTTPAGALHVKDSGAQTFSIESSGAVTRSTLISREVSANQAHYSAYTSQTLGATTFLGDWAFRVTQVNPSALKSDAILRVNTGDTITEVLRATSDSYVGIGTTTPQTILEVATTTSGKSAILMPRDSTANRPPTAVNGMIRYNTDKGAIEGYSGGNWVMMAPGPVVLHKSSAQTQISSSNAENTAFSYTVPANFMGANGAIRVRIYGTLLNNTGNNRTVRLRLKFGGTTLYDDTSGNLGSSGNRRAFWIEFTIMNAGATNSQKLAGFLTISANGAPTVGMGEVTNTNTLNSTVFGIASSADTTTDTDVEVTAQLSNSSANLVWRTEMAIVELLP